ncbi:hypothetical protein P175DRAFT_0492608 [Aspergillus ochraceoroseus IBT 24754]|nr:uncharacterized protein P175DRAFT_0492608 [Aspergillus ochraceoroseus IBT 24754]PTU21997.1 hypothetical protein P175DRAFT_0492608 [Aspergillus ochraceoroseus IBT 24754]
MYDAAYPGVVVEISYSQNGKDLKKLAWDYIVHSNGDIKVVVGIDINYGGMQDSTLSMWRPSYVHEEGEDMDLLEIQQEIKNQPFRAKDGSHVNQMKSIPLKLSDFAPDELSASFQGIQTEISYAKLAEVLTFAERMHRARESGPGIKSRRRTRKRRRSSSSMEEMKTDDEAKHRRQEEKAEERSAICDDNFVPPFRKRKS